MFAAKIVQIERNTKKFIFFISEVQPIFMERSDIKIVQTEYKTFEFT